MPLFVILIPAASFLFGAVLVWILNERKNRQELMFLEEDMLAQIRERYQAYVALEEQISGAIDQFETRETDFAETLHKQSQRILKLKLAFDKASGTECSDSPEGETWMESTAFIDAVHMRTAEAHEEASQSFQEELAGWKQKLADTEDQKRVELERQGDALSELTQQIEAMGTLSTSLENSKSELGEAQAERDRVIDAAGLDRKDFLARIAELEANAAASEETENDDLIKAKEELEQQRTRTADLQTELNDARGEVQQALEARAAATEQYESTLETVAKTERLEVRAQDLAGKLELKALELTTLKRHHDEFGESQASEIDALKTELEQLRPLKDEVEAVKRAAGEFKTELQTSEQMVADLVNDNEALEANRTQADSDLERLKSELEASQSNCSAAEENAKSQAEDSGSELDNIRSELDAARADYSETESKLTEARSQQEEYSTSMDAKLEEAEAAKDDLRKALEGAKAEGEESLSALQAELDEARNQCTATEAQVSSANDEKAQAESSWNEKLQEAEAASTTANSALEEARTSQAELEATLNQKLDEASHETQEVRDELEKIQRQHEEASRSAGSRCDDLSHQISDYESRASQLEDELAEATRGRAAAVAEATAKGEQITHAEAKTSELSDEISSLQSRCESAERDTIERSDEAESLRSELELANDQHQVELNEARTSFQAAEVEATSRGEEVASLESQLAEAQEAIQRAEAEQAEQKLQSDAELERTLGQLEEKTRDLTAALSKYESISDELGTKAKEVTELHDRIGELEPELARAKEDADSLRVNNHDLAARHSEEKLGLISKYEEKNALFEELQEAHSEACTDRSQQADHICELEDKLSEQEQSMTKMSIEISALNSHLQSNQQKTEGKETRISHLMRALEDTQGIVAEKDSTVEAAKSVLAELRPMFEALESRLAPGAEEPVAAASMPLTDPRADDDSDDDDDGKKRYWDSLC